MNKKCLIIFLILLSLVLAEDDHLFYTVYPDIQARGTAMPTYRATNPIETMQISTVYLAKNEREAFQVFYRSVGKDHKIKLQVTPFVNEQKETLPMEIFAEEFLYTSIFGDTIADPLVPYNNSYGKVLNGTNMMYYVEFHSSKNQREGKYTGTVNILENDKVVDTKKITAEVWNFTLPESRYSETAMGLYNSASGYGATKGFLELNGVKFENGDVEAGSKDLAKKILKGYHEYLLSHGVNTYEIPRWLIDEDPKEAELAMNDVRRKTFMIPEVFSNGYNGESLSNRAIEIINKYKNIIGDNELLKDKAYFYLIDEPNFSNVDIVKKYNGTIEFLNKVLPGFHSVVPFCNDFNKTYETVKGKSDIFCPNQNFFTNEYYLNKSISKDWNRIWRYPGDNLYGGFFICIWNVLAAGVMRRIMFWQQYLLKTTGVLFWNIGYFLNDPWKDRVIPGKHGVANDNGDGYLIYPGKPIGQDPTVPIASLRFKQMVDGLDDYDYIKLAEEFLGKEIATSFVKEVLYGSNSGLKNIISKEGGYTAWECNSLENVRLKIGKALNQAHFEHKFGEWKLAVDGGETHDTLHIRKCSVCGTQEMKRISINKNENENENKKIGLLTIIGAAAVVLVLLIIIFFIIKRIRMKNKIDEVQQGVETMERPLM